MSPGTQTALLAPRQMLPRRKPGSHEFCASAVTACVTVLRLLTRSPDADALEAHVDGFGDHRAHLTIQRARDDAADGQGQQHDTQYAKALVHVMWS